MHCEAGRVTFAPHAGAPATTDGIAMNLALFDFDGTITTRDTFTDFVHCAVAPHRIAFGKTALAPVIAGYRLGVVSADVIRACVVRVGFSGMPQTRALDIASEFSRTALRRCVRPNAMARIDWRRAQGDTVAVVSGSLDLYFADWCREHGLALLCSSLEVDGGTLTGRYAGRQCDGAEKVRRVRAAFDLSTFESIYAYGDSKGDRAMLALAQRRYYQWREQL
jgi:phosphatidylglycerophosphatase C